MSVGIAVVAGRSKGGTGGGEADAIVLIADKQMTWSDGLKADVEVEKKLELREGWHLLFAGDASLAYEIGWYLRRVPVRDYRTRQALIEKTQGVYERLREREFERLVLRRNLLTKKLVIGRDAPPHLLAQYYRSSADFDRDFGSDLILAGFDGPRAMVLTIKDGAPGIDQLGSFAVIGQGETAAKPRLYELGAQAHDGLEAALYNAIAAKIAAENVASVGPGEDAWVLRRGRRVHRVDPALIADLTLVVNTASRSPLSAVRPKRPPRAWRERLRVYAARVRAGGEPTW